ncbi:6-phosphogluconate dehydrogenase [Hyaloraphidium curvatum]|nr:6-phosphogluconate dehydrogenase [Hyaloraphidium curvatum]
MAAAALPQSYRVAFLGLGVMGFPMAGHLAVRPPQHSVRVWNRTAAKAKAWAEKYPGTVGESPADAAKDADFVMICVGNDDDLRSVVLGEHGALAGMKPGAVIVDHTTASASVARELHALAKERGVGFLDAPVSGGEAGAVNGALTVMCGGDEGDYARAEPVIRAAYAKMCKRLGGVGAGQQTKMVNQVCIAGLLQGLSEALVLAKNAGLDVDEVVDVISKGAAQSWQMENRYKTMAAGKFDLGFQVKWMRKDLAIVLEEAKKRGLTMPVTALVDQFYAEVEQMGGEKWDTSSLIARLEAKKTLSK